jgi:hypothetical protein
LLYFFVAFLYIVFLKEGPLERLPFACEIIAKFS